MTRMAAGADDGLCVTGSGRSSSGTRAGCTERTADLVLLARRALDFAFQRNPAMPFRLVLMRARSSRMSGLYTKKILRKPDSLCAEVERRTMERRDFLDLSPPDDDCDLHQRFNVVICLEKRELLREEEEQNHPCSPHIDRCVVGFHAHVTKKAKGSPALYVPPVCSPHLSNTSGARNPRVPARFAFEMGLKRIHLVHRVRRDGIRYHVPSILIRITYLLRRHAALLPRFSLTRFDVVCVELVPGPDSAMRVFRCGSGVKTCTIGWGRDVHALSCRSN